MKRFLFIYFIFHLSCFSLQGASILDSLHQALAKQSEKNSTEKVDLLLDISWENRRMNAGEMLRIAEYALQSAESLDYTLGKANAYKNMGIAWNIKGETDSAVLYMSRALKEAEKQTNQQLKLRILNNLGLIYQRLGNYEVGLEYYQQSVLLSEQLHDNLLGVTLMNMGFLKQKMKDYDKALEYYRRALNYAEAEENSIRISSCLYNIGGIYRAKNQLEVALQYHQRAQKIAIRNEDNLLLCKILNSIGRIYAAKNRNAEAKEAFEEAKILAVEIDDQETVLQSDLEIARLLQQEGSIKVAIEVAERGLNLAQKTMTKPEEAAFFNLLAGLEKQNGNIAKAYAYLQDYLLLSQLLSNQDKTRRIHALETRYHIQQKEIEVAFLEAKNEKKDAIISRQATEFSAVLVGVLLLTFIALILYRTNQLRKNQSKLLKEKVEERTEELQKINQKLEQSNQELERFAYITSHDLKEPLRNISGFTRLLERKLQLQLDDEARTFLKFVMKNTQQMNRLLDDVLQFTQIGKQRTELETIDLNKMLVNVEKELAPKIKEKGAIVRFTKMPNIIGHTTHIALIFSNLIENALKFNESENPMVHVSCCRKGEEWHFTVRDNGIGIEVDFYQQIFQMFKRLHNRSDYEGSGMGLALVQKLVQQHQGSVWLDSTVGKGSTFYFSLPAVRKEASRVPIDRVLIGN